MLHDARSGRAPEIILSLHRRGRVRRAPRSVAAAAGIAGSVAAAAVCAQVVELDPVVVTATRSEARAFDVPASVDTIDAATIRNAQPLVNLSETLVRVPGIVAHNRQNYAQDLQISSRGFGARSTFGVRGVRLYQDDIPATMPDGQGQTGSFSLLSARRIEVLRGPFSALYGNASGGVISVFTEEGSDEPRAEIVASAGSYEMWTAGLKLSGSGAGGRYVAAASRFDTGGYRDHSAARRDLINAKATFDLAGTTKITLVGSQQVQPDTQDPLGLNRAQWEADPRQADSAATTFDTRKTIHQLQGGAAIEHKLTDQWSLRATGYAGHRVVRQYLALRGDGATSSGGVTDLDRDFGGVDVRAVWRGKLGGGPLTFTVGGAWDRQDERRRGFVNNNGDLGDLRRDEDDVVTATAGYAQAQWDFAPRWSLTAGVRVNDVRFRSTDHYIVGPNPDDSGSRSFSRATPVAGLVFHATDGLNLYASYGEGFETPTFAELAYQPNGTGLNFALDASTSRAFEIGAKWLAGRAHRVNVAAFAIRTDDEIVVDAATGGRTTFKNAGRTKRYGAEVLWDADYGGGWTSHVALTWLSAEFDDAFTSGAPPVVVPAGNKLPGVPPTSAYAEVAYSPPALPGFAVGAELQHEGKIYVNERNSDAAPAYVIGNLRATYTRTIDTPSAMLPKGVTISVYGRVNNIADRNYIGSVIVADTNGRFFEPAPGRNWTAGVSFNAAF
jgi:iron complex outermembrane receptor protein